VLEVRVEGAYLFKQVAEQMRAAGNRSLEREMVRALEKAAAPVERDVRREYDTLPSRGGYAAVFSRSLRIRLGRRTGGRSATLTLRAYADGTKERRDINRLEAGQLRHPVYGRSRRLRKGVRAGTALANPWTVTAIRGGYFRRGTADAADHATRAMIGVVEDYAQKMID
jgi:hypothetical protein